MGRSHQVIGTFSIASYCQEAPGYLVYGKVVRDERVVA